MEIKTPPPNAFDQIIQDDDVSALKFFANGELEIDVVRGQRFAGAPLDEHVFDEVVAWLNAYPGAQMVRYTSWRFFLTQMDEGVIFAERLPRMLLTLDDLFHYGWFQDDQRRTLFDGLSQAPFIRLLGVPLWAKTQLAVAIGNTLKAQMNPLLGPGPWVTYEMEDDEWARLIASKAAAGAECLITASGHLAQQALQSGLKALWAPHPGYVDESLSLAGWPILDLSLWRNDQGHMRVAWNQFRASTASHNYQTPTPGALPIVHSVSSPTPITRQEPEPEVPHVMAEVTADAVKPPADWGSSALEDSPGWELGEPPEPEQNKIPDFAPEMTPQLSDISLEPPPEFSKPEGDA